MTLGIKWGSTPSGVSYAHSLNSARDAVQQLKAGIRGDAFHTLLAKAESFVTWARSNGVEPLILPMPSSGYRVNILEDIPAMVGCSVVEMTTSHPFSAHGGTGHRRGVEMVNINADLRGCVVLILDDVVTSGASLESLASACLSAGADKAFKVVFAKA